MKTPGPNTLTDAELESLAESVSLIEKKIGERYLKVKDLWLRTEVVQALKEAVPHVHRQLHGRHEQDRTDAEEWVQKWAPLIGKLWSS